MINIPYVSLPECLTKLLVSNIQNSTHTNNNLELYINENKELNALVRKIFRDIDPDGFLGKILSVAGWLGIRNRLAAVYIEYAMNGYFPEMANLTLVTDIINIENKLRHFTPSGFSRAFLLGFYAKLGLIQMRKLTDTKSLAIGLTPLIIKDEHIEFMKYSKAKSTRIDWVMLQLIQFDYFLGTERMNNLLQSGLRYESLFSLLNGEEQKRVIENCLTYGSSIFDSEIFLTDTFIHS
jgi:hypothetical protein